MAREFKSYLSGFTKLCDNYCENAKKVVSGPGYVKLVNIYQKGLAASTAGLSRVLSQHYDSADKDRRQQLDEFVQLSGVLPLLEEANRVIGKNSLDPDALFAAGGIFEELKKIVKLIPGLGPLGPFVGAIPGLLDLIDQFKDAIGKLFGPSGSGGSKTVERPPPVPNKIITPCEWVTIYEGKTEAEYDIFATYPTEGPRGEVEVRVDDKIDARLLENHYLQYRGRKIEVHLRQGGAASADVGYQPHPSLR